MIEQVKEVLCATNNQIRIPFEFDDQSFLREIKREREKLKKEKEKEKEREREREREGEREKGEREREIFFILIPIT